MRVTLSVVGFEGRQRTASIEIPDSVMLGAGIHLILQSNESLSLRVPIEAVDVDPESQNVILRIPKDFEFKNELLNSKNYEWFETKYT